MLAIWTVLAPLRSLAHYGVWYIVSVGTEELIQGLAVIVTSFFVVGYICKNSFKPNKALFILGLTAIIAVCIVAGIPVPSVTLVQMHIGVSVLVLAVLAVVYFIINSKLA